MSFIDNGDSLPAAKSNKNPLPTGADPNQYFAASDHNAHRQALIDTQAFLRGNFKFFDSNGANPVTVLNVSGAPAVSAAKGSLAIDRTNAALYQNTDGASTWTQVGSGLPPWATVLNDTLKGGTITSAWNSRTPSATWTADGTGYHIDNGIAESFLSWENAPLNFFDANWAIEADISFTATALGGVSTDAGFVVDGGAGAVGSGYIRVFMHSTLALVGWDKFGSGGSSAATSFSSAAHKFRCVVNAARGRMSLWIDGVCVASFAQTVGTPTRVGIWSNPGHANFANVKIFKTADPT